MKALVILHVYIGLLLVGAFAGNWYQRGQPLWETLRWYAVVNETAAYAAQMREATAR